jgi:hypothetical protein
MLVSRTDESTPARLLVIDAGEESAFRPLNGVGGIPGPVTGYPQFPDMTPLWREAGVTVVRSFDWVSRLDTRNNPTSLFPDWDAPVDDPASYNFAATDEWVEAVTAAGAIGTLRAAREAQRALVLERLCDCAGQARDFAAVLAELTSGAV